MINIHFPTNVTKHNMSNSIKTKRFIRSQGDLDGACLLYSLVNAVNTLTKKQITPKKWTALIDEVYDGRDFLDGRSGSGRMDLVLFTTTTLVHNYLQELDPSNKYEVELISNSKGIDRIEDLYGLPKNIKKLESPKDLDYLIDKKSILVVGNVDHWFCVVDLDKSNANIACSYIYNTNSDYSEQKSINLGRVFNRVDSIKNILKNIECIIKISRINKQSI